MLALVLVATGPYKQFLPSLIDSAAEFLSVLHQPFILTDEPSAFRGCVAHKVEHAPWPAPTLQRYGMICAHAAALRTYEHVYYLDADSLFVAPVGAEILGGLVATLHPRFHSTPAAAWWCEDPASRACVPAHERGARALPPPYYAGGFQGGEARRFLSACDAMRVAIDDDLARGVVARCHDESHWNRYCLDHAPDRVLGAAYCYPQGGGAAKDLESIQPRILALLKPLDFIRMRGI
jgi:histo-blood group ABO system transferase